MSLRQFQPPEFMDFAERKIRELYQIINIEIRSSDYAPRDRHPYVNFEREYKVDAEDVRRIDLFGCQVYGNFTVAVGRQLGFPKKKVESMEELLTMNPEDIIFGYVFYSAVIPIDKDRGRRDYYFMKIETDDFETVTKSKGLKLIHHDKKLEESIDVPLQGLPLEEALERLILMSKTLGKDT
ncbi:MAG: hypothetical protein Q8R04_01940 [Nanoarchaeota archaeon]|nr:hypothetical protein [Nanoarchaeota archaeon]